MSCIMCYDGWVEIRCIRVLDKASGSKAWHGVVWLVVSFIYPA